jgi:RND family efflux transporter MFP subunit
MTARPLPILRAALAASLLALPACNKGGAEPGSTEVPAVALRPDNIAVADQRPMASGPSISGALLPARVATLRAEVAGTVVQTLVEQGETVAQGQILVRLDDSAIKDAALSARSAVRTATEALAVAKRNAERSERLAQAGALAERDLEQARWTVTNADGALADAAARLASAEKLQEKTVIRAPFAGIVSERPASGGDVLQTGNPIVTVVDPRSLRLEATVPVTALGALKVGSSADFSVGGYEGKAFVGLVERINPAVDPATRQVRVYVSIPNVGGRLVSGLFAQGRIALEQRTTLAVPQNAIDLKGLAPMVRRLKGGIVELVTVELGFRDDVAQLFEIRSGLVAGDTVLVGPGSGLAKGTPVRITRE